MDIQVAHTLLQPFVTFFSALLVSGVGATLATSFLKQAWIPVPAQKYPRATAAVASVVATVISIYFSNLHLLLNGWFQYAAFGVGVLIVSAITYTHLVKGSPIEPGTGVAQ